MFENNVWRDGDIRFSLNKSVAAPYFLNPCKQSSPLIVA